MLHNLKFYLQLYVVKTSGDAKAENASQLTVDVMDAEIVQMEQMS